MKDDETLDRAAYAGRWVALTGDVVAGVGETPAEARRLAQRNRPKERFALQFVEPDGGDVLPLSPLLDRLRPFLHTQPQPVYLVGGAVRDALLGKPSHDLDFVLPAQAIRLAYKVGDYLQAPAYALDEERDTGRVVLAALETMLDFARFRGADLNADLRDRDFTINALALPATARTTAALIDPCGGLADLQARQLRLTHPGAIAHDPVRALRAVRLALTFDLTLTEETAAAVQTAVPLLATVSPERIRDELVKLLQTDAPHRALAQLHALGLLPALLPELAALADVAQSPPHHEPVLAHTGSVLRWLLLVEQALAGVETAVPHLTALLAPFAAPLQDHLARVEDGGVNGRLLLRLGGLFHDVGKAETETVDENGRIRFLGHDKVGAKMAARRLRQLALSNKAIDHVYAIVDNHMRPLLLAQTIMPQGSLSRRTVFRFFRAAGTAGVDVLLLALADHLATYDGPGDADVWRAQQAVTATLLDHYFNRPAESVAPPPLVNGRDLMQALQLQPGPEIGRLLRLITEAQAAGELHTRDDAIQFARQSRP